MHWHHSEPEGCFWLRVSSFGVGFVLKFELQNFVFETNEFISFSAQANSTRHIL
jgi:hypothetical protein